MPRTLTADIKIPIEAHYVTVDLPFDLADYLGVSSEVETVVDFNLALTVERASSATTDAEAEIEAAAWRDELDREERLICYSVSWSDD